MALELINLIMLPTNGFKSMYNRPFNVNFTYNDIDYAERLNRNYDTSAREINNYLGNCISLGNTQKITDIFNGWEENRMVFLLSVREKDSFSNFSKVYYYQGYTDYDGVSYSGLIDDNMKFIINSIYEFNEISNYNNSNLEATSNLTLLSNQSDDVYLSDLYSLSHDSILYECRDKETNNTVNNTGLLTSVKPIYKSSNDISTYLYDMIKQVKNTTLSNYDNLTLTRGELYGHMGSKYTPKLTKSEFVKKIYMSLLPTIGDTTLFFTKRMFDEIFPNAFNSNSVILKTRNQSNVDGRFSENFYGNNAETKIALELSHSVSNHMAKNLLATLSFVVKSEPQPIGYSVNILGANHFISHLNMDGVYSAIEKVTSCIADIIMPMINRHDLTLAVMCDFNILTVNKISVSINGQPAIDYFIPSFADGLFSPMIGDINTFNGNKDSFINLFDGFSPYNDRLAPIAM